MSYQIPVIDFGHFDTNPKQVAQEVLEACKTIGFFYIVNHGLPKDQIEHSFELAKDFFDLPSEEKHWILRIKSKEIIKSFNFRNFVDGKSFAPLPPIFEKEQAFVEGFSRACHATAMRVLQAFAIALEIPEEEGGANWFSDRHTYDKPSGEILRFLKYPKGGESTYKEPVRAGAHSDYGSITLLFQKDVPGLEVKASRTEWISAPLIQDSILVNVGDQLQEWTNGLFKSTLHRVTFLPEHAHKDRYSMPVFIHPEDATLLSPIPSSIIPPPSEDVLNGVAKKGEIISAGEHLKRRLDATYKY
ncbi:hypothetical protein BDA99DRAFT_586520 [Phascolomyces articulosus]|uniref:Fe2OG dioxygenase domain-containing protein n=1 Tax=Phascolomyces articulosus TaxID=60185 RepID=A0AAD5JUG4_9FUNG|nr:hypothetical protein BDA99DRAFT_586520 [Phascolomyces articulosus]